MKIILRPRAVFALTWLSIREYNRSGRILVEAASVAAIAWLFFLPWGVSGTPPDQFFGLGGLFILVLTCYTAFTVMRLGNRPQAYVIASRRIGRGGYLMGLFLTGFLVAVGSYLFFSGLVLLMNLVQHKEFLILPDTWLLGTIPLMLNMAIAVAFVTLISPIVLPGWTRIGLIALVAFGLTTLASNTGVVARVGLGDVLRPVQAVVGALLMPAARGFTLSVQADYGVAVWPILLAQVVFALVLLAIALLVFKRRELIFL